MERDTHSVRTADNVAVGYDTAGIGSRTLAFIIDSLIVGFVDFLVTLLLVALMPEGGIPVTLVIAGAPVLLLLGYFILAETVSGGRTPGKRALSLRVVRVDGGAPGFEEALVRGVVRLLDIVVGWIPMFFHPQSRRLGDLAAGTVVVRERRAAGVGAPWQPAPWQTAPWAPHPAAPPPPPWGHQPPAPPWQVPPPAPETVFGLGPTEYAAIRALLTRPGLAPDRRQRLAMEMATRLYERLQLPPWAPERQQPPEVFLHSLLAAASPAAAPW